MKKQKWMQSVKVIWFLILLPAYVSLLFLVKYYMPWPGIIVVGSVMALNGVTGIDRMFKNAGHQPKEQHMNMG